ncbi:MAG: 50S ribosomal protein L21 [Bacteroidetes bacterium]|nr:50S ribosomal protein L21 [Bacteroidota bacterium]
MYAIVNIAGQQFKVQENKPVYVHRIDANEGDALKFDQVLLVDNNGSVTVGAPLISGAAVTAKVLSHLKGDKVIVFKKKRRKGYQKMNGHRQALTKIQIETISA